MTPTRRAMIVAGVATVALSLVMSIAPALAANVGTLKIFDAATGTELGNNPHACSFYGLFESSTPTAAHWSLVNLADDSVADEGGYTPPGLAVTANLSPAPGHYRLDWTPVGSNGKSKILWVDATCSSPTAPTEDPTPTPTPTPTEVTAPTEDPTPTPTPTPTEVTAPTEDPTPTPTPTPTEVTAPSDDPTPTPTPTPTEVTAPSEDPTPTEQAVEASQSTPSPAASPEQNVEAGNSDTSTTLPDTAVPVPESGVLATIGLLLIIAAHAGTRRKRQLPVA